MTIYEWPHLSAHHHHAVLTGFTDRHQFLTVRAGARRVDVSVSPTGRSVRVWVDGTEVTR